MKVLLFFFLMISGFSHSQYMGGSAKDEGRKLIDSPSFLIEGFTNGYVKYELAIDREGNVTGVRSLESNLKSTPARYELRNYVKTLRFEAGTYFPKFHHAIVKITMIQPN